MVESNVPPATTAANDELVTDPVCRMVKPKSQMKAHTVYKGKTYYFCWDDDKRMFDAHPDHWIPNDLDSPAG